MTSTTIRTSLTAALASAALVLSGCAAAAEDEAPAMEAAPMMTEVIVVGSQAYYSNEIIAEIYAQALESAGYEVERKFQIGQRDAYLPELESGAVDLFPEYTGNLLQFYAPDTMATQADEVYEELQGALPEGLTALAMSPATDQDSYNVTAEFAAENNLVSIADLAGIDGLVLGGAPELEERPYGPTGLLETYGVVVAFDATGDITVDALLEGVISLANVYSGDPRIAEFGLVTLADPEGLFLASNVVPIASSDVAAELAAIIDPISLALTPEALVALNLQSIKDQLSAADIAAAWLSENGF
ncbi:MAG: ABC transporter substrate-binding protein [Pontimonas sp.]|nr:MAG: glycine/betaine ABC transporter [actinobacterium acMicro-4]MCF8522895.1 ABC transporter substrate-binding protein [Pontimonas sp.]MCF8548206.1 ABC transporter substrate-binding protein [Pontimonas sp.]